MREKDVKINVDCIQYVSARYMKGVREYVEYWVYNYDTGKLHRQRKSIRKSLPSRERNKVAQTLIREINDLLHAGYTMGLKKEAPAIRTLKALEAFQKANEIKDSENGARSNSNYRSYLNSDYHE
ncbi:MAG: hypothetical protein AAFP89_22050 [Bacteroidota bacterium]